ncbi:TetR/AcrR family transcriptional regulator [Rhodococcus sp. IEGM 1330]|uniref:TetR/AcrR family transcriptional regulator n=1 Tax=Rhodococcus sp. IEGM 1330 TaxID=3082225 RepID=UPI002955DD71|nr:TetR/AcrR family transcriptional regulator [Rhodococcus sp. IEGM 1330]MDV8022750.1 TetR/AcrR family transcriptional regulator [Rhodococcus sp. IEGM 1330]
MPRRSTARNDMLHSAIALFRQRGVEATSVADVLEHAGAPRGSVYHHFPQGRPQLVEEATRSAGAFMGSMISAGLTTLGPIRTVEAIISGFRDQLLATDFASGCPVASVAIEGPQSPAALAAAGESFTSWEDTIAASLWQHGIAQDRARGLATMALSAVEGALLMCKAQRSTRALDRVEKELMFLLDAVIDSSG